MISAAGEGSSTHELRLAPEASSPAAARRWLQGILSDEPGTFVQSVSLVLGEVVTNVVLHARTEMVVRTTTSAPGKVRIEVVDRDTTGKPLLRRPEVGASTGRGLLLVDALSSSWGVLDEEGGKTLWFEMSSPEVPAPRVWRSTAPPGLGGRDGRR